MLWRCQQVIIWCFKNVAKNQRPSLNKIRLSAKFLHKILNNDLFLLFIPSIKFDSLFYQFD